MRILHILDHSIPLQSGYSFRILAILNQQRALGWDTAHLTSPKHSRPFVAEEQIDGWPFFRTPPVGKTISAIPLAREWALMRNTEKRILEVIEFEKPEIIHAHSPVLNAVPAIRVGKRMKIPVVYEVRAFWEDAAASHGTGSEAGPRYKATRCLETWALKRADAITTICEGLRGDIVNRDIPANRVTVIPNAVNAEEFGGGSAPDPKLLNELGLTDCIVLGFVGSFYGYEGLHLICQAMPQILQNQPDTKLLLVGGGPEEETLKTLIRDLSIQDNVVFTGRVPHDQVQKYYDLIDLLVYPRTRIRLTDLVTPLKPLEAMAMNKIMVASDVGGHKELIRDGETGNLFKADDVNDLAKTVLQVLAKRSDWPIQAIQCIVHRVSHRKKVMQ